MCIFSDASPSSPTSGKVGGEVKLSISYRNSTLFIMVMHIKDLVSRDTELTAENCNHFVNYLLVLGWCRTGGTISLPAIFPAAN